MPIVTNWKKKWARYPLLFQETEFMRQVEMTIGGKPRSEDEFQDIVRRIQAALDLKSSDALLDICCGNGLITMHLAKSCKTVVGIDFSPAMIEIANKHHKLANTTFRVHDAHELVRLRESTDTEFDKVLMYGSVQYFSKKAVASLLDAILTLTSAAPVILFGVVPNADKRWTLFNTLRKRSLYVLYKLRGRDAFGTWWKESTIRRMCKERGLICDFYLLDRCTDQRSSHYRFDVRIVRQPRAGEG